MDRGTMGNLLCLGAQCPRGSEVILGQDAHIFLYEGGGCSAYLGVAMHTIPNLSDGSLCPGAIEQAIRPDDPHFPRYNTSCVEAHGLRLHVEHHWLRLKTRTTSKEVKLYPSR